MVAHLEYQTQVLKLIDSTTIIGRMGDYFQIFDPCVSRRHFKICRQGELYHLFNLSEKSDTYVNGEKVLEAGVVLPDFATIECGKSTFTFVNLVAVKMDSGIIEADLEDISTGRIWNSTGPLAALMYRTATLLQEKSWSEQVVKLETLKLISTYMDTPILVIMEAGLSPDSYHTVVTYRKPINSIPSQIIVPKSVISECFRSRRAVTRQTSPDSILCIPIETEPLQSVLYMRRPFLNAFTKNEVMISAAVGKLIAFFHNHQKLKNQIERSQKLEMIGTVAAGIVHSFNNILGGIIGNIGLLTEEIQEQSLPECLEYIENIQSALKDAISLTQDILSYTRDIGTERTQLNIHKLLFNIYKIYRPALPGNIHFIITPHSIDVFTKGNHSQLTQAFLNLIQNASQAMPEGGEICVKCACVSSEVIKVRSLSKSLPKKQYIEIMFKDSGIGMDEHTLTRIFTPLFTTKPAPEGTGLGLSYTLAVIERHGGTITVESKPEKGTTFYVYLPLEDVALDDATSY